MSKFLFLVMFILSCLISQCQYTLHDAFPTCAISIDYKSGKFGSGFILSDSVGVYIVTANHMLYEMDTITNKITNKLLGDTITIGAYSNSVNAERLNKIAINLSMLNQSGVIASDPVNDIAMIKIGRVQNGMVNYYEAVGEHITKTITPVTLADLKYYNDVTLGADIFLVGYPKNVGLRSGQIEIEKPLICKGIISAKNVKNRTIILNATVYHGNSGGPVFCYIFSLQQFKLVGIATQLIPFESEVYQNGKLLKGIGVFNTSNYSVVVPMDFLMPLFNKLKVIP